MGLEAATYIHQLNPTNPVGATDPKAQGDDHIRMIKSTLQATFPNITGPVTATQSAINNAAGSGITGFAAPTAKIKATGAFGAGVATTALRSDSQGLIDLTDTFAWTGQHSWTVQIREADGSAGTPSYSFTNENNTGFYRHAANVIGVSVAGAARSFLDTVGIQCPDGGVGNPAFRFAADPDTGMYRVGANVAALAAGATQVLVWTNVSGTFRVPWGIADGAVGTPGIQFDNDPDTGIYRTASNNFRMTAGGIDVWGFANAAGVAINQPFGVINSVTDGTAGAPIYSFNNDADTGFYRIGSGRIGMALDGAGFEVGFKNIPQNSQSANYTAVLADSGKHLLHPNGGGAGDIFTIPANASVPYDIGTVLTFVNRDSNAISIAITTDTMILAGTTTTGTRTLGQNGIATAIKVEATTWIISGTGLS